MMIIKKQVRRSQALGVDQFKIVEEEYSNPRIAAPVHAENILNLLKPACVISPKSSKINLQDLEPGQIQQMRPRPTHPRLSPQEVSCSHEEVFCPEPFPISPMASSHSPTPTLLRIDSFIADFGGFRGVTAAQSGSPRNKKTNVVLKPLELSPKAKSKMQSDTAKAHEPMPTPMPSFLSNNNRWVAGKTTTVDLPANAEAAVCNNNSSDVLFERLPRRATIAARPIFRNSSRSQLVSDVKSPEDDAPMIRLDLGQTSSVAALRRSSGNFVCETRTVPF